ncbi:hypothetical protein Scep_029741 [Stephania cephalantha]|uniref:Uncharacterized protein n=1 Tax=Stephania cephalantha TaxID=152367 RepID=A0AAP0E186_9MAGN
MERERGERHRPAARTGGEGGQRNDSSRSGAACEAEDDGDQQRQQLADGMQWRLRRRLGCADVAARRCNGDAEAAWGGAARRADHHQRSEKHNGWTTSSAASSGGPVARTAIPAPGCGAAVTPARRNSSSGGAGEWQLWRRRHRRGSAVNGAVARCRNDRSSTRGEIRRISTTRWM